MATLTVTLPAIVKLTNTADHRVVFQPYHENFTVGLPAGAAVEYEVSTVGQFFYYQKQATETGLTFEQLQSFDAETALIKVIDLPSIVTLTNVASTAVNFQPYRENFTVSIGVGDAIELEATTVGQVLYYLSQAQTNKGIQIDQAAKQ